MKRPLFELVGVRFAYDPARPVLDGADFVLNEGERVGLVGSNGSGKTTLFHIMVGLISHESGDIVAFGQERREEADFIEVRAKAGLLFQDPDDQLFSPTVLEDVAFGPLNLGKSHDEAHDIARKTLADLGLAGFEDRITYKLSGGERRLVSLATVLAMEPEALLLDEPSNALDEETRSRLLDILLGLPQAMVVISHDGTFLGPLATRRVRLADGKLKDA